MTLHYGMAVHRNGDATGTEPVDFRKDVEGLFVRAGALRRGTGILVAGTAGWTFTLNAAWFVTQRATGDGFQLWGNDGAITLSTNAAGTALPTSAPASGLSRYYRVWVRHRANESGLDSTSVPDAGVEFSSAASSPTLPALPAGATEVATNLMTSAATSTASTGNTLTQTMPWSANRGGVVPCRSAAELTTLSALGTPEHPVWGSLLGSLYRCSGSGVFVRVDPFAPVTATFNTGAPVADDTTLTTLSIPSAPIATKVYVLVSGRGGFVGAERQFQILVSSSAGTMAADPSERVASPASRFVTVVAGGVLDLPADTAATITLKSDSDGTSWFVGGAVATRWAS